MDPEKSSLIVPILLITVGTGWLLTTLGVVAGVNWVWTLGLAVAGLVIFVIGGFNKLTVVVAPFLILSSCLSVLRQTERLHLDTEVPILVILAGALLLVARIPAIPVPHWIIEEQKQKRRDADG